MKLSISNLAWDARYDDLMYKYLRSRKLHLELAPTRIFPWADSEIGNRTIGPYEHVEDAVSLQHILEAHYGIEIVSMQSLLYPLSENIFVSSTYRRYLLDYLKRAVDFAKVVKCPNLVFGSPKNRKIPKNMSLASAGKIAVDFFGELADYAQENGTCISIEAVPEIMGTNFINYTSQAFEFARSIDKPGIKVTVDLGTILANGEDLRDVFTDENMPLINHIHISEPGLAPLKKRPEFNQLAEILKTAGYDKSVSVEILKYPDIRLIQGAMNYMISIFNN